MNTPTHNAGLRRITAQSRKAQQARAMSPAKALRLSLARAADEVFDLALAVTGVSATAPTLEDLVGDMPTDMGLVLLSGADDRRGVLGVDPTVMAGLIESQTIGRVSGSAARDRKATATDVALMAPLFEDFLARLADHLRGEADAFWAVPCVARERVDTLALLGLALQAPEYRCFRLTVDLANGAKQGEILIALPLLDTTTEEGDTETALAGQDSASRFRAAMLGAPTRIDAVLHRMSMPYSQLLKIAPGQQFDLPPEALARITLQAGTTVAVRGAKLGMVNGFRAVRLQPSAPPSASADTGWDTTVLKTGAMAGAGPPLDVASSPVTAQGDSAALESPEPVQMTPLADLDPLPDLDDLDLPPLDFDPLPGAG